MSRKRLQSRQDGLLEMPHPALHVVADGREPVCSISICKWLISKTRLGSSTTDSSKHMVVEKSLILADIHASLASIPDSRESKKRRDLLLVN
jgi:hypothetical protein